MLMTRAVVTVNVTASGGVAHSANWTAANGGYLEAISVRNATANGISTAANITITHGGQTFWTATSTGTSNTTLSYYPRIQLWGNTTVLLGLTSNATPPPYVGRFPVAAGVPVNVAVTSGGGASAGAKSVQVDLYISGN